MKLFYALSMMTITMFISEKSGGGGAIGNGGGPDGDRKACIVNPRLCEEHPADETSSNETPVKKPVQGGVGN